MYEIITEKINKYYGQIHALKDVSLEIEENSLFGLLGVNGAGKTTLIKILTCLNRAKLKKSPTFPRRKQPSRRISP